MPLTLADSSLINEPEVSEQTVSKTGEPRVSEAIDVGGTIPANKSRVTHKKQNGVFYTPGLATQLLAKWAIRNSTDLVLEPSFGGCGFLDAALERLTQLDAIDAFGQLYGCDIDPKAFEHLDELLPSASNTGRFKKRDFLSVKLEDLGISGVDALIGNPPYVSWHTMLADQRDAAGKILTPSGRTLKKKGSLWAFFVIHSLNFLKPGGRMAWILPSGFLHSDYAIPLRSIVAAYFTRTLAVALEERLFLDEGTEESSVILLCEGYQVGRPDSMRLTSAKNLTQLAEIIDQWTEGQSLGHIWNQRASLLTAPPHIVKCYSSLTNSESYKSLEQILRIRIGLVSGDNKFFVLSKEQAKKHALPISVLKPIVARLVHFKGLEISEHDLEALVDEGARCLLINTLNQDSEPALEAYLNCYPEGRLSANYTFSKRPIWHQVDDGLNPDAFFSCMSSFGPVLMLNTAGTTCTNTIYRVWFSNKASASLKQQVALSLQSTFSQFSAEVVGRSHGSSALKLEPSEVLRLGLLLANSDIDPAVAYNEVDSQLRLGNLEAARRAADDFLISHGLLTQEDAKLLETGLVALRAIRQRKR